MKMDLLNGDSRLSKLVIVQLIRRGFKISLRKEMADRIRLHFLTGSKL